MANNSSPLDVNTAARDDLINLPGIGPAMADRIIAARPFDSLEDLRRVDGVGPGLLGRIGSLIQLSKPNKEYTIASEEVVEVEDVMSDEQVLSEDLVEGDDKMLEIFLKTCFFALSILFFSSSLIGYSQSSQLPGATFDDFGPK